METFRMKLKCTKCGYINNISKFKEINIIPSGSERCCPKCNITGVLDGSLVFINDIDKLRKIDVGDLIKRMKKDFGIKK